MFGEQEDPSPPDRRAATQRSVLRRGAVSASTRQIPGFNAPSAGRHAVPRGYVQLSEEKTFSDYLRILYRFRLLIVIFGLMGFGLAAFHNFTAQRLYGSSALVNIGSYIPISEGLVGKNLREDTTKDDYISTQIALLQSFKVAERVLRDFEIRRFVHRVRTAGENEPYATPEDTDPAGAEMSLALKGYLDMIRVQEIRSTTLVRITAITPKPEMSARIANLHAEEFIKVVLEDRKRAASANLEILKSRLEEAKAKLSAAKERKIAYAKEHPAIAANVELLQRNFELRYGTLLQGINDASAELSERWAERRAMDRKGPSDIALGVGELNKYMNVEKLRSEYDAWKKVIKNDQHPYLVDYRRQIKLAEEAVEKYARQRKESVELAYRMTRDREALLRKEFEKLTEQEREHSQVKVEYDALLLDEALAKEEADKIGERYNDAVMNAESEQKNIVLVDAAVMEPIPVSPRVMANSLKGCLLGLLLGLILAFLIDLSDSSIRTIADLERMTDLQVLGVIPRFGGSSARLSAMEEGEPPADQPEADAAGDTRTRRSRQLMLVSEPQSRESEAVRSILVSMTGTASSDDPRIILITSGEKGEGKTTFAANLAAAIAESGDQTLLIDADLRLPSLHCYFDLPEESPGLSACLAGKTTLFDAVRETGIPQLSLLSAGEGPESPTYFLRSPKMAEVLTEASRIFDYVVVDSPPVGAVSDPLLIARHVHAVAMVIRCRTTPRHLVTSTIKRLQRVGAPILGLVLNDVQKSSGRETYGYYSEAYYRRGPSGERARRRRSPARPSAECSGAAKALSVVRGLVKKYPALRGAGIVFIFTVVFLAGFMVSQIPSVQGLFTAEEDDYSAAIPPQAELNLHAASGTAPDTASNTATAPAGQRAPAMTRDEAAIGAQLAPGAEEPEETVEPASSMQSSGAEAQGLSDESVYAELIYGNATGAGQKMEAAPVAAVPEAAPPAAQPEAADKDPAVQEPAPGSAAAAPSPAIFSVPAAAPVPTAALAPDTAAKQVQPDPAKRTIIAVPERTSAVPSGWYVQLAFSRVRSAAEAYRTELAKTGHSCELQTVARGDVRFYRVLLGPAFSREEAIRSLAALRVRANFGQRYHIRHFP